MVNKKGLLVVISAPSGTGKTTICNGVLKSLRNSVFSVSVTTRPARQGEVHGKDYFFVTTKEFKNLLKHKKLLEWARVHGHYYGTPKDFVDRKISEGKVVILDIDVQGALKLKGYPNAVFVFLMAPSFETLKQRLIGRGSEDQKSIAIRLRNARRELKYLKYYDYLVINDEIDLAIKRVKSIIATELAQKQK